jgi:predicted 2-oxoglutarate/Fe(II)-dependent dioxygenase YbiX
VVVTAQAPALVLPNLLNAEHCSGLIKLWHKSGNKLENIVISAGIAKTDSDTKIRSDVSIPLDSPVSMELISVMQRRLLPEIRKAFNFEATRFEFFQIGRYDAAAGGHFAPHRDNTSVGLRHRRYALIVNLNTGEYEGGFLRLPEYGTQLYAPPKGGAVVFSCSLLHMATPVIKGQRFILVGFSWSEEEQRVFAPEQSGSLLETMPPNQSV